MVHDHMRVHLKEIKETESVLDLAEGQPWVEKAIASTDEATPDEIKQVRELRSEKRPIEGEITLRKVDEVYLVDGHISTHIYLLCSRCARPFSYTAEPRFSALYCQDPAMAGVGHLEGDKPAGHNAGFARHAHDTSTFGGKDLDITYVSVEFIDLDQVVAEQLRLQIPFQPLCQPQSGGECLGLCPQCGTDLNTGRCACAKLQKSTPFQVLQNLQVGSSTNKLTNKSKR